MQKAVDSCLKHRYFYRVDTELIGVNAARPRQKIGRVRIAAIASQPRSREVYKRIPLTSGPLYPASVCLNESVIGVFLRIAVDAREHGRRDDQCPFRVTGRDVLREQRISVRWRCSGINYVVCTGPDNRNLFADANKMRVNGSRGVGKIVRKRLVKCGDVENRPRRAERNFRGPRRLADSCRDRIPIRDNGPRRVNSTPCN